MTLSTWVLLIVALLISHFAAYCYGAIRGYRLFERAHYQPLVRWVQRLVGDMTTATLEGSASANQRNVQLLTQNRLLRRKAVVLAVKYGEASRRLRSPATRLELLSRVVAELVATNERFARK